MKLPRDFWFLTHRCPTEFTDSHRFLCGLGGGGFKRVTQISQMTQIFLTYSVLMTQIYPTTISYTQMRPIRSDLRRLFANLCGSPCRGQKSKGLAESAYAIKLRLSVA